MEMGSNRNCQNPNCTAAPKTTSQANLNIKPPDFLVDKEEFPSYKRRLERWSRSCGIQKSLQGDIVLMYAGKSQIAEMLDREIGDKIVNNEKGVEIIVETLDKWYGKENSVDLYQGQDVVEFITKYEDAYNRLSNFGEKISDKLKGMLLLERNLVS